MPNRLAPEELYTLLEDEECYWREAAMPEKLTIAEFFSLFNRHQEDSRLIGSADSEEYLAVVTYLVARSNNG